MMNGAAHDATDDLCPNISMNASLRIGQKFNKMERKEQKPADNPIRRFLKKRSLPTEQGIVILRKCVLCTVTTIE